MESSDDVTRRDESLPKQPLSDQAAGDVRTVAKGGAVQIGGQISQRSLSFLFFVVAFRVLGRADYGLYRQVAQILSIAAQLGLAGFNYAAMRFVSRARAASAQGEVRGAARVALAGAGVGSAVVFFALLLLAGVLARPFADEARDASELAALLRLGALYVPLFAVLQVLRYVSQGYKTMVPSVVVGNVIQPLVRFSLGVTALLVGFAVAGVVVTLVMSVAVAVVFAVFYYRSMLTPDERAAPPARPVRPMVRFALPQAGASLLGVQTLGLGIIFVGLFATDAQVGIFAAALALQGPGTVFLGGIVNIWAPVVADLYEKGEIERLGSLYKTINRWIATFSFPVFAALIIEADLFVRLFAPDAGRTGAVVVAILAAGNIFYTGTGPTGYVISMTGRPGVNFANSVVAVALYSLGAALFVPRYGAIGMAAVDAVVTALVNSARVVEAKLLVGVQPFGASFVKPVVATLAGAIVLLAGELLLPFDTTASDIMLLVVGAVVYVVVLRTLGVDAEERYVLERIKKRVMAARRRS